MEESTSHAAERKRVSGRDLSYRPPKFAKAKAAEPSSTGDSNPPENGEIQVGLSVEDSAARGTQSSVPIAGAIVEQDKNVGVDPEASNESASALQLEASSQPDQQQCIARDDVVPKGANTAGRRGSATEASQVMKQGIETTEDTSACIKVVNKQASKYLTSAIDTSCKDRPSGIHPHEANSGCNCLAPNGRDSSRGNVEVTRRYHVVSCVGTKTSHAGDNFFDRPRHGGSTGHPSIQQVPTYSSPRGPFENPADSPE